MPEYRIVKRREGNVHIEVGMPLRGEFYGYFEVIRDRGTYDDLITSGGLWFDPTDEEAKLALIDYDGAYFLDERVINILLGEGVVVEDVFFPDYHCI
ncbi:MAG TPA: hypothetical protein P5539_05555 [Mesotoga sp.]|nr:hypothetical protein [Mesotoga sp.]